MRIASGLTQCELAKSIGHTQSSICHYESGRRVPDIETCHLIASALSTSDRKVFIEEIFPHPSVKV
ncbi:MULTISPECIES: helix-turn-helix transcriptional regulator [Citrobacter freundii complex]|nr:MULTISPECIES: helix-turn-helix transcriptional regulator [Citrobacter freundii complex]MCC2939591.1 helix-turn-helix domain-containing protein [Citrobacter freundii]MDT7357486.1 helix-turn-helix transcriptional regulator [Citrobacter freundii]MDU4809568.1 helix-turn-helix transcriptional regulator [Citrobacter freundii]UVV98267.1 helix-turn-helix domain-containing protein [Citrobacter freundii]